MRKLATIMALAGASAFGGIQELMDRRSADFANRIYGFDNIRRALQRQKCDPTRNAHNSIAQGNRHGGPHLHQREIARRQRQAAGRHANSY